MSEEISFVDQTIFKENIGDCFRACVASIFKFPISKMPNFWEQTQDVSEYWKLTNSWMRSNFGVICFSCSVTPGHEYLLDDIICVATGKQNRSGEDHAVVWRNGCIHDPHPSRKGLINPPDVFTFFIPINPTFIRRIK